MVRLNMRARRLSAIFLCGVASLVPCGQGSGQAPAAPSDVRRIRFVKNPDPVPPFTLRDIDGKTLSSSELRGKVVLLNFWATWCGPCRAEIPDLIELQKKYGDALQIIGLDVDDDDVAEVKKFVEKNGINYPVGMATNEIRIQYGGVAALPTSFVLNKEGRVVQKHEGLRNPLLYEYEIRSLSNLAIPARVETFEDTGEIFLKHADRANSLPGVDMSKLTPEQRSIASTPKAALAVASSRLRNAAFMIAAAPSAKRVPQKSSPKSRATPAQLR